MDALGELETSHAADGTAWVRLLEALGAQVLELSPTEAARVLGGSALPEAEVEQLSRICQKVMADGLCRSLDHRSLRAGGEERWRRTAISRGGPERLLAASLDLSAERHAQRQFKELESWLVTLGEALPFDFWICDHTGRCLLQNPTSLARMGNAVGLTPDQLSLPPLDRERRQRAFDRTRTGSVFREEIAEGDRAVIRVATPIVSDRGVGGALLVDLDVSELKRTEERLRRLLVELSDTQTELLRKTKLAALGEMASALAHEVRNPLGSISNAAALLKRQPAANPNVAPLCQVLDEEVSRLDGLVNALLQFAEPSTAPLQATNLSQLVRDQVQSILRSEDAVARLTVAFDLDESAPSVAASPPRLALAVSHLIRNAVQAMPEKGRLGLRVGSATLGKRACVEVRVSDTGPGISDAIKSRLFEPFVTGRSIGSGLGLTIVRRVLEEHEGELEVHSEPGKGTAFTLRLPVSP